MNTFEEIVEIMIARFRKEPEENKKEFLECKEKDLISYHTSLGRSIRNEFKLWDQSWTPDIRNMVDYSTDHPDAVSMNIIKEIWKRMKENE